MTQGLHEVCRNTLSGQSVDVRSQQVSVVCDLELRPGPVLSGRPRTSANETRTETIMYVSVVHGSGLLT